MAREITPNGNGARQAFRDIHNFLAGQFIGATRPEALLDEVLKCLFVKFYVDTGRASALSDADDVFLYAEAARHVFRSVRQDFPELYEPDTEILLDPSSISFVLRRCDFPLLDEERDPIGDAYEVFVGSEAQGRSGQFFTPRSVADLLVDAVDLQEGESVLDPACGAGGFLTSVVRRMRRLGVAGDDLAMYVGKSVYGIEKDKFLARLALPHVALLSGSHSQIVCGDSISLTAEDGSSLEPLLPQGGFDVVVTNPPFGKRIVAATPEVLSRYDLAYKWKRNSNGAMAKTESLRRSTPPQVLFVEACLQMLREGGRLGIVLPESLLSNKSYTYVIEYLKSQAELEAVIGMPEALFKTSGKGGTHTKTCLVVATRSSRPQGRALFMAEAKWCGQDSRARSIPHDDLPAIARELAAFRSDGAIEADSTGYIVGFHELEGHVLAPRYYDPGLIGLLDGMQDTHDLLKFGDLLEAGVLEMRTGDEVGKLAYGTGDIPFIRTSDLSNWELKADPKHAVSREIYERLRAKQDVRPEDILMVKDGTYLIGTCALITSADTQVLYQSHLYKIRVCRNEFGFDAYSLLATLSSDVVQQQIRSKQFTQDIIDSLGDRIRELVLPVPKSAATRNSISALTKRSIELRAEAKLLADEARRSVFRV